MKKEKGVQKGVMEGGERRRAGARKKKKERGGGGGRGRTNTWKGKRTNGEGDGFPSGYPLAKLAGVLVHETRLLPKPEYVYLWLLLLAHVQASNTLISCLSYFSFLDKNKTKQTPLAPFCPLFPS